MQIPKPTPAARALFDAVVPATDDRVEVKPMFGNLAAFVNGNMFLGIFGPDVGVKLSNADQHALRAAGGQPFGPAERPMGGYVSFPANMTPESAHVWVARALAYVGEMPPKVKKPSKKR
jgi:hypothetical protein